MVNFNNEAWIKDQDTANPIGNGEPIYLRGVSISYGFKSLSATSPKVFQDTTLSFNDRLANITYIGLEQPKIVINGLIDLDNSDGLLDSDSSKRIITVGRLFELGKSARTFYFWDSRILDKIINDSDGAVENPYTAGSMPVVISNIKITSSANSVNQLTYSIELVEDRIIDDI